ncbi:hypothetical protein E1B28_010744 [Marasmius oreades]|uniref:Beta-galactosidase domain-containing protein n=1 Tax=Marasmius oreades TaxID=181124 RepID=A0A9P7RSN5_9AGAR|nr:uncharacterized protein E1B28_010744 [Marasmius oreades]KAG7089034.1 hypothetical protein E1B28_010744 [Marasmius oreades]
MILEWGEVLSTGRELSIYMGGFYIILLVQFNGTHLLGRFDAYPNRYDCAHPDIWKPVPENYHEYHLEVNSWQPLYIPEYQGGSPQAWGPNTPDYTGCYALTGPAFESVFHRQLWADNVKLLNYYPLYGGTSWGNIPYHGVYTSYDWGAAISEPRTLGTKYTELKLQGLFLRSSPEFYKTDVVANSTEPDLLGSISTVGNTSLTFVTLLRNPDTEAGFWIVRQKDSTSTAVSRFKLTVTSSLSGDRKMQIPQIAPAITLNGRESKVIVTDYLFGTSRALYSTASVLFAGTIDGRDVLFLYGDSEQEHEAALNLNGSPTVTNLTTPLIKIQQSSLSSSGSISIITFAKGIKGLHTVHSSRERLVLFADTKTAGTFWSPAIADPNDPHGNFWSIGTNETVLVGGPYLVRTAKITKGLLELTGDFDVTHRPSASVEGNRGPEGRKTLTIIAPQSVTKASWNGKPLDFEGSFVESACRIAGLPEDGFATGNATSFIEGIPDLSANEWKYADSLPEIREDWDDSQWVVANHTSTNVLFPMWYGDGRVLYGCDYGFCEGAVVWRGHFNETGVEKSVNLSINGGQGFAASVWLNSVFLNTSFGNSSNSANNVNETDQLFVFPEDALKKGQDNVITVLQDNMGLNENWYTQDQMKSPRGIRGFQLNPSGNFSEWRVQGKVGGYKNFPDKHRGVMNEGGFFGERKGWHLPNFDTSSWRTRNISSGLPDLKAGVGFFVTTFDLDIPTGFDIPMSINFEDLDYFQNRSVGTEEYKPYRAIFFVNGWMMGKVIGNLGPQVRFPVHEGILDYQGANTLAVVVWAMTPNVTISPQVRLRVDGVFQGGILNIRKSNPGWSAEGRE